MPRRIGRIRRIMRHEWRSLSADRTLWAVVALSALSIGYAVYNGMSWARSQQASVRTIAEEREMKVARARAEVLRYEQQLAANPSASPAPALPRAARYYTIANSYDAALPPAPLCPSGRAIFIRLTPTSRCGTAV